MNRHTSLNCGDINLAAALNSVGIPLDQFDPCSLVLRDNGQNYARFHVMPRSVDGSYYTVRLMDFWRSPSDCNDPAFSAIMAFVRAGRDAGCSTSQDWFHYAHTYLEEMDANHPDHPARMDDVPEFVSKNPDGSASHIFAFAYNREYCFQIILMQILKNS